MTADTLTPRQHEVLRAIGRDQLSYADAGDALGISEQTVRNHVKGIKKASGLDMPARAAATRVYIGVLEDLLAGRSK